MLGRLKDLVYRRRRVGVDAKGNVFYLARDAQGQYTRRMVEYAGEADPKSLHPLWHTWLGHRRKNPPTPEDITRWEEEFRLQQIRIKQYEMADAKLRLEEMAQRQREGRDFHEDYSASTFLELIRRGMSKDQAAAPIVHDLDPLLPQQDISVGELPQPPTVKWEGTSSTPEQDISKTSTSTTEPPRPTQQPQQFGAKGPEGPTHEEWDMKRVDRHSDL